VAHGGDGIEAEKLKVKEYNVITFNLQPSTGLVTADRFGGGIVHLKNGVEAGQAQNL
jgi:hypothetical protein